MDSSVPVDKRTERPVLVDRSEQGVKVSNNSVDLDGSADFQVQTGVAGSNDSNTAKANVATEGPNRPGLYRVVNSKQDVVVTDNKITAKGSSKIRIQTGSFSTSS